MAQSLLNFSFMLAVMCVAFFRIPPFYSVPMGLSDIRSHRTFQLGFIFALIVGLGVGEMLFGRYTSHSALHLV